MMDARKLAAWLYLGNAAVLATHEIDSAYWHEWELFRLPGDIQFFLVVNLVLLGFVLFGARQVVLWARGAKAFSYLLAAAGLFAFTIHACFLALGNPQFEFPVSLGLLGATLLLSLAQVLVVRRCRKPG